MSSTEDSSETGMKMKKLKLMKREAQNALELSKSKYSQKFCDKWLTIFHPWLTRCDDDDNKPFCRACQCRLDCNRCHLQRHERTGKHARNLEVLVSKGEGAARQNLSIRQERSKYYQQRKKLNSSMASSHDNSEHCMETGEDYIEETEAGGDTSFQFVQTEAASGDHFTEETTMKQELVDGHSDPLPTRASARKSNARSAAAAAAKKNNASGASGIVVKKERMKLLMQIQKDKNDLMDSFKELMGGSSGYQLSPKKEKNHVDLFFDSVSSSVKALSPKLIAEAKMRVSQLICELELRALTDDDAAAAVTVSATMAGGGNAFIINQPATAAILHHPQHTAQQGQHYQTLS